MRNEERPAGSWDRLGRALFWEFLQNVPLVAGLLWGLDAWQAGKWGLAATWMVGGSVVGALAIRATEGRIVSGHREPWRVVLANVLVMAGLMFVVAVYLAAGWSAWWSDLLLGFGAGIGLGVAQDLAAGSPVGWTHAFALGLCVFLGLFGIRLLAVHWPPLPSVLVISGLVTVLIVVADYGPWRVRSDPQEVSF
ncbi:MAG: hypothetical protein P8129_05310 [Anaerolineae bacterium]|jgi:hypothetical protein